MLLLILSPNFNNYSVFVVLLCAGWCATKRTELVLHMRKIFIKRTYKRPKPQHHLQGSEAVQLETWQRSKQPWMHQGAHYASACRAACPSAYVNTCIDYPPFVRTQYVRINLRDFYKLHSQQLLKLQQIKKTNIYMSIYIHIYLFFK